MKSLSFSRFSRGYAVVVLFWLSLSSLFSQSPDSLVGKTFDMQVTGATHPFPSVGRFLLLFQGHTDYTVYKISDRNDSTGTYLYQRTALNLARISFGDQSGAVLEFSSPSNGFFTIGAQFGNAYQEGVFKAYSGTAPSSILRKVIRVVSNGGNLNFGEAGTYRILTTSTTNYVVQNADGDIVHSGQYGYVKKNRASGVFHFQDSTHAGGFIVLNFDDSNKGFSLVRKSTGDSIQLGAFSLSTLQAPVFTSQPTGRNVEVGASTTFSAPATGTGPITYQWYKDGNLIGGATESSYTIPSVQLWDAGSYRVIARNLAAEVSSVSAVLVPVCKYSLSTNPLFVDFRGGSHNVNIFATGTCAWTASETNDWITITSPTSGQGNAVFSFSVDANETATPRTGHIQVAGKTLVVAQGARFALADISGKTFTLEFDDSEEQDRLLIIGSGTNREMKLVSFDSNVATETFTYDYSVTSSSEAQINFNPGAGSIQLNYSSATKGTFAVTTESGAQAGVFTMSSSAPDFNEDSRGDLVLQSSTGAFAAWHFQNTNFLGVQLLRGGIPPNNGARGFGAADFNRDGYSDLVMQDASGRIVVWFMQGNNRIGGVNLRNGTAATGFRAFSVADVNSDGHPDILFQHSTDRRLIAWLFDGATFLRGLSIRNGQPAASGWRAVSAGDLNGDAHADILLQHTSGQISAWFLNGGQFVSAETLRDGIAPAKWKVMGMGDVDEDGNRDILFQNESNQVAAWLFEGKEFARAIFLRDGRAAGSGWKVVAPR